MLTEDNTKKLIDTDVKSTDTQRAEAPQVEDEIIDIQLAMPKKSKFRINGDPNKIIELNITDMNIIDRLEKAWVTLQKEIDKVAKLDTEDEQLTKKLKDIDKALRKQIDFIFDANVSEVLADNGTMYDAYQGQIRYEHILDTLLELYATNINTEYKKFRARTQKHTSKYTKR